MTIVDPDLGVIPTGQHHAAEPTPIYDEAARACLYDPQPEPTTPTPEEEQ